MRTFAAQRVSSHKSIASAGLVPKGCVSWPGISGCCRVCAASACTSERAAQWEALSYSYLWLPGAVGQPACYMLNPSVCVCTHLGLCSLPSQMNLADSERIAGCLESVGYACAEDASDADVLVGGGRHREETQPWLAPAEAQVLMLVHPLVLLSCRSTTHAPSVKRQR
jgi:hypothetical protein